VSLTRPNDESALTDFDEVVRRPVFAATRRPFVQSAPAASQSAPALPPPDMRLIGVAINAGKKQALLRTAQQPRGRWIGEGESIDGWVLRGVRADAAVVASGPQTHELRLYPTLGQAKQ
jgi:general secretion pathway protein N